MALSPGESAQVGAYDAALRGREAGRGPELRRRRRHLRGHAAPAAGGGADHRRSASSGCSTRSPPRPPSRVDHGNNLLLALGEDLGGGRWSVRVQVRPLVSLVWLAALIMAIGGGARRLRPALPQRAGRRRRGRQRGAREARLMNRFCVPLGVFVAARRGAGHRHPPLPGQGDHRLAAARQGGPAVLAARRWREPERTVNTQRPQGPLVPAQRLGHLVRGVPRRA